VIEAAPPIQEQGSDSDNSGLEEQRLIDLDAIDDTEAVSGKTFLTRLNTAGSTDSTGAKRGIKTSIGVGEKAKEKA
jgi:hypothetical protein